MVGEWGLSHYAAAKGGVISLIRTAAIELDPWGITANAISPAGTRAARSLVESLPDDMVDRIPTGFSPIVTDGMDQFGLLGQLGLPGYNRPGPKVTPTLRLRPGAAQKR